MSSVRAIESEVTIKSGISTECTIGRGIAGGGTPSVTAHTIFFEFSDETDIVLTGYWDNAFISNAIEATTPVTYNGKTVVSASLDGTAWYIRPTETWEVLFNNTVSFFADESNYPYCWIADLADIEIPLGSIWRVTFGGIAYVLEITQESERYGGLLGNPKYGGGADDGSEVPFYFYRTPWGAWSGGADVEADSRHTVKIERQIVA